MRPQDRPAIGGLARVAPADREPIVWRLLTLLELHPGDLLVELGCAFSDHLLALAELVPLDYQALVVDPSPERLARVVGSPKLRPVAMDPLRFAAYPMQCDRMLLEAALLLGNTGAELARGLFGRLRPGGRLLAIESGVRQASLATRASAAPVFRTLEGAGFEVTRRAAPVGSGCVELFLGVMPAAS